MIPAILLAVGIGFLYSYFVVHPATPFLKQFAAMPAPIGYAVWAFDGIDRLPLDFLRQLARALLDLGVDPNAALAVMKHESNFRADAKNEQMVDGKKRLIAGGLIQWINSTAKAYGTNLAQLLSMDVMGQLPFVIAYWATMAKEFPSRKGRWTPEQALRAVFFPKCVGKPDDFVIGDKDVIPAGDTDAQKKAARFIKLIYEQNKGLDKNRDGKITAAEVDISAKSIYEKAKSRPPIMI